MRMLYRKSTGRETFWDSFGIIFFSASCSAWQIRFPDQHIHSLSLFPLIPLTVPSHPSHCSLSSLSLFPLIPLTLPSHSSHSSLSSLSLFPLIPLIPLTLPSHPSHSSLSSLSSLSTIYYSMTVYQFSWKIIHLKRNKRWVLHRIYTQRTVAIVWENHRKCIKFCD